MRNVSKLLYADGLPWAAGRMLNKHEQSVTGAWFAWSYQGVVPCFTRHCLLVFLWKQVISQRRFARIWMVGDIGGDIIYGQ